MRSACGQAREGGEPTHQTMPVLRGQNGRDLVEMKQRMRHRVDGGGQGRIGTGGVRLEFQPRSAIPEKNRGEGLHTAAWGWL